MSSSGSIVWAQTLGGSSDDSIYTISTNSNDGIVFAAGSVKSSTLLVSTNQDFFISSHKTSDGSLLKFRVLGGTRNDYLIGIHANRNGHIFIAGGSSSTSPTRMSYSTWNSILMQKLDQSLSDSDCWSQSIAPTFSAVTSALSGKWKIIDLTTYPDA